MHAHSRVDEDDDPLAARCLLAIGRMRRSERMLVTLPVVWNRGGRAVSCVARDLNLHGLFVATNEIIEPNSLMHLRVALPERPIELFVTARLIGRTVAGAGIGVEIFIVDDNSRTAWVHFYQRLQQQQAPAEPAAAFDQPRRRSL
jgi:hypothetical protein